MLVIKMLFGMSLSITMNFHLHCATRKPFFEQLAKAVPEHIPPLTGRFCESVSTLDCPQATYEIMQPLPLTTSVAVMDIGTPWLVSSAVVREDRDNLVRFWLACPDDVLEPLWNGSLGQATREMVAQLVPTTFFSDQQINVRNQLGQFLQGGFQQPGAIRAVIATFLLSPPGQFRIVNPQKHLPAWLVPSYLSL